MGKRFIVAAMLLFLLAAPVLYKAHAFEMDIGAVTWYSWWSPMFRGEMLNMVRHIHYVAKDNIQLHNTFKMKPQFMFGPIVSFKIIDQLYFSNVFVFSTPYRVVARDIFTNPDYITTGHPLDVYTYYKNTLRINKYDLDSTVSYTIRHFFKVFAGFKYQGYRYEGTQYDYVYTVSLASIISPFYYLGKTRSSSDAYGPGLGIGFNVRIVRNLYALINFSGVYLRSRIATKGERYEISYSKIYYDRVTMGFNVYGFNSTASLAYLIEAANLVVSLGGRYQYLKYYIHDSGMRWIHNGYNTPFMATLAEMRIRENYNKSIDQFYGITLSVIYRVSTEKKQG